MRIVQVSTDQYSTPPNFGGAIETYVHGVSQELHKLGTEVHIIGLSNQSMLYQGINFHPFPRTILTELLNLFTMNEVWKGRLGIAYKLFNPANRKIVSSSIMIYQILKKITQDYGPIDIIHCHYLSTCIGPILFKRYFNPNVKLVLQRHNSPKTGSLYGLIDRWLVNRFDIFAGVSNFIKEQYKHLHKIPSKRLTVIHNAINTSFFQYNLDQRSLFRSKRCISNKYVILYIGRIVPEKGLLHIIKCLPEVIKSIPEVKLLILGGGGPPDKDYYHEITQTITKLQIQNAVLNLGKVDFTHLPRIYSSSDLVVVPSVWEDPCPSVVMEALSCGRAIVAFSVGGIPEIIPNERYGYLISSSNNLSDAIIKARSTNTNENFQIRRMWAVQTFSWNAIAQELTKKYFNLTHANSTRRC